MSFHSDFQNGTVEHKRAREIVKRAGYHAGGSVDEREDKAIAKAAAKIAVRKHENHEHGGEHTPGLKSGGKVQGHHSHHHLGRFARGGRARGPARINIVIATGGGEAERQMAMQQGLKLGSAIPKPGMGAPPPAAAMPRPPMPPPGAPQGAPQGMPPAMPPRPPMATGGRAYPLSAGSGGAAGRLEKHQAYSDSVVVRAHTRRRAGGRI